MKRNNPKLRWAKTTGAAVRLRSRKRGEAAQITPEWLYENAPDRCPLLGIELRYDNDASMADSATVDRRDNDLGYTPDNCWIISMKANRIKTNASLDELERVVTNLRRLMSNPYAA